MEKATANKVRDILERVFETQQGDIIVSGMLGVFIIEYCEVELIEPNNTIKFDKVKKPYPIATSGLCWIFVHPGMSLRDMRLMNDDEKEITNLENYGIDAMVLLLDM